MNRVIDDRRGGMPGSPAVPSRRGPARKEAGGDAPPPGGFSLVELLVVVALIALLLALLMPALDGAVYQAELARCGGNQKGIAHAALIYASDHKRAYPQPRLGRLETQEPDFLGIQRANYGRDLRPVLQPYMAAGSLRCPLSAEIDLSPEGPRAETWLFANYDLWFGGRFTAPAGAKGMYRVGDRFTWTDTAMAEEYRFRLLASDKNLIRIQATSGVQASHPDPAKGRMVPLVYREYPTGTAEHTPLLDGPTGGYVTQSRWYTSGTIDRGPLDLNFAYDDASVARLNGLGTTLESEPRLKRVPAHFNDQNAPWRIHIPAH